MDKPLTRKVSRLGNSLGITIPKALANHLEIQLGDEMELTTNEKQEIVARKIQKQRIPEGIRPEVLEAFYDIVHEDHDILMDLKDK